MSPDGSSIRKVTTEQLAIVVPAAVVAAVAGINAWWQVRINQQTFDHQTKLAVQTRVAATYEDMLEMVGWQMEAIEATKPMIMMGDPPEPPPPPPETDRIRKVQARIGVHGSRDVKAVLGRWAKRRNEFFNDAWYLDRIQHDQSSRTKADYGVTLSEQWHKVETARVDLREIVRELEDAVSSELRA
jgi:hypothetical protein